MTLPVFRSAGADVNVLAAGGTTNVPVPAGAALNDFLLLVVMGGNAGGNSITAAGWTPIDSVAASAFQSGVYLYYRIGTASEPATYPVQQSGGNVGRAVILCWSVVDVSVPINVNAKTAAQSGVAIGANISLQNITTTVNDCLEIGVSFEYNGRTPTLSATGSQTARKVTTTAGLCFIVTEEPIPTLGAITGKKHSTSISGDFFSFSVAIQPAASGGTTLTPGTGHLVFTGYQPTVTQAASGNHTQDPGTGHLVFTGKAMSVARTVGFYSEPMTNENGGLLVSTIIPQVTVQRVSDLGIVDLNLKNVSTDGSGRINIRDATVLVSGNWYCLVTCDTGANPLSGNRAYQAS